LLGIKLLPITWLQMDIQAL